VKSINREINEISETEEIHRKIRRSKGQLPIFCPSDLLIFL